MTTVTQSSNEWSQQDTRRMLHAVYRVGNLEKTDNVYQNALGLDKIRYRDIPEDKYSNAFYGYGPEKSNFALELTYNYGVESYDIGEGFGHFGVAVKDVAETVAKLRGIDGVKVTREPGPVKGGDTVIAFVEDPDGYKWELLQKPDFKEPLCQVMLRVTDLDKAIAYYRDALGMTLLRERDNPEYKYKLAFMGYGPEEETCVLELTYNYGVTQYKPGNAWGQVAISTKDVFKTEEQIKEAGGTITRPAGAIPGLGTKILATTDPDGWKYVFVDEEDFMKELQEAGTA